MDRSRKFNLGGRSIDLYFRQMCQRDTSASVHENGGE